jgi:phosphopantetheinyl transferase
MSGSSMEWSRDWREYNESLVKRGELYFTLSFLENCDRDQDKINRGKLGRPIGQSARRQIGLIYDQG